MDSSPRQIYLDNNATTHPLEDVVQAVADGMTTFHGNPSSPHSHGRNARDALARARIQVAQFVNVDENRILFTSGGTESNNLVLQGVFKQKSKAGLVTTAVEHSSILNTAYALEAEGVELTVLPVDEFGMISIDGLVKVLEQPKTLVSIQWANSETGVLQPILQIGEICHHFDVPLHVDAAQAAGKVSIQFDELPIDFLTFAAHKLHGPQGVGAVCMSDQNSLAPLFWGGDQESGFRPGTENLPGILGFGIACEIRSAEFNHAVMHMTTLRDYFEEHIQDCFSDVKRNGHYFERVPNTTNLMFPHVDGMAMLARLELEGIICSQSSACTSHLPEPSHVLQAMGLTSEQAFGSIRFSFSIQNTMEQVKHAAEVVCDVYRNLRSVNKLAV